MASNATRVSHAKKAEILLPFGPYCARETISVEVPAVGPVVAAMPMKM